MKKRFSTSELGSMMIEALAMLALIALVTPILYRKTAERTTELQDINTAGELRAIIKAVDDYVSANYDAIAGGESVTNSCKGTGWDHKTQSYASFKNATDAKITVPIGHFCEFLPYGILDSSGNAHQSRLFSSNYQIVLKLKGSASATVEKGDKVITAFVITEPNNDIQEIRSSSIASMIGGNGGYVTSTSGSGDSSTGVISGNLGIWSVDDSKTELGVSVSKNAVVAASIQGISSQSAKIDISGVLYRVNTGDLDLNTMSTNLYMGAKGSTTRHDIINIGKVIVGSETAGTNDKLYIATGDLSIGKNGNINIGTGGNLNMTNGNISVTKGNLTLSEGNATLTKGDLTLSNGKATISGDLSADAGAFTVANSGAVKALSFATNKDHIQLNINDKSVINQPLEVNGCTREEGYSFCVKGNSYFDGDVKIAGTFDAKNLHAREKLTVGGTTAGTGKTLAVTYTSDTAGEMNFGEGFFDVKKTAADKGTLDFGDFLKVSRTDTKFEVGTTDKKNASLVHLKTTAGALKMNKDEAFFNIKKDDSTYSQFYMKPDGSMSLTGKSSISLNGDSFKISTQSKKNDKIESIVDSFKITTPSGTEGTKTIVTAGTNNFKVETASVDFLAGGTRRSFNVKNMDVHVRAGNSETDFLRMSNNGADTAQIDISNTGMIMHQKDTTNTNILKIDLENTSGSNTDYPIYIRKGAIEMNVANTDQTLNNYVKSDRFIANTAVGGLVNGETATNYEVNPAYTSVMHDIKLTTRGGARLSDILPDFINKGIYVVDNTYPAKGFSSCGTLSDTKKVNDLNSYFTKSRESKISVTNCTSLSNEVSPWAGFVPTPTCPPGYAKVITFTPASFAMAQAGYPQATTGQHNDLHQNWGYAGPLNPEDSSPVPLYAQKNTWLKSFVQTSYKSGDNSASSGAASDFEGWDVGIGFIYPYTQYKTYADKTGESGGKNYDSSGSETAGTKVIWNMFPVYAGTLEGYATVYCYFNRGGGKFTNSPYVDTAYDQLSSFRAPGEKRVNEDDNSTYIGRLNSDSSGLNEW